MTHTRTMLWLWVVVVVVVGGKGVQGRDGRSMTWAQVANSDQSDTPEYDDTFFRNDDYEYVEDAQEVELSPVPQSGASPPQAERRTLGSLLGLLVPEEPLGTRPARSSLTTTTTRPPASFLESMVRTIDNLVVDDLRGWSKFLTHMNTRLTTTTTTPRPVPAPQQPQEELVLVSDEFGRQHVVTINDIVSSLAQLDEQTITDLLLGPGDPAQPSQPGRAPSHPSVSIPIGVDLSKGFTQSRLPSQTQARTSTNPTRTPTPSNLTPINPKPTHDTPTHTPTSSGRNPTTATNSNHGSSHNPTNSNSNPTNPSHTPTNPKSSPSRTPNHNTPSSTRRPVIIPSRTPHQPFVRGTNTRTHNPAHAPPRTHTSSRVSTSSSLRGTFNHASSQSSFPGVVRALSTQIPSQSVARGTATSIPIRTQTQPVIRGTPIHTNARPNTNLPDFIVPSSSGSNHNAARRSSHEVQRPARHTGPVEAAPSPEEEGEMIVVRDETGAVHVVTIQDIISSLSSLNPNDAQDLLFGETRPGPPTPPAAPGLLQSTRLVANGVTLGHQPQRVQGSGNVQVGGPQVITDSAGNVRAAPQAGGLFTIQDIIAAAEASEGPQLPRPATHNQLTPVYHNRHHTVLTPTTTAQPSLMDALRQQDLPEPLVQYLASPSVTQQVTHTPAQQPDPPGLGATLGGLLSRIVGGQQQQQQQQPQQSQAVMSHLGMALPTPIHFRESNKQSTNSVQVTKKPAQDDILPPALSHLSQAVQDALRRQANDVPTFVPPDSQPKASARADTGPVEFISAEEQDQSLVASPQRHTPVILPPSLLEKMPPPVLRKLTKQYLEAQVDRQDQAAHHTAEDRIGKKKKKKQHYQYVELHQPVHQAFPPPLPAYAAPLSAYPPPLPAYPAPVHPHSGYPDHHGYGDDGYSDYGSLHPMLDIFLLADVTKVKKIGDTNLSVKAPKIGDPSYFVDTRPQYGSHGHH